MKGRDPVTPELRVLVFERDGGCLAVTVGGLDPMTCRGPLTADHVKDQPPIGAPIVKRPPERRRRYRAPSDARHLATVCAHHHLDGWATANRPALREYLEQVNA
ncbi:MAG TPA: hypothetical protein VGK17_01455 [Propionicimonas sp.]|jgi:hypothetical protein